MVVVTIYEQVMMKESYYHAKFDLSQIVSEEEGNIQSFVMPQSGQPNPDHYILTLLFVLSPRRANTQFFK